MKKLNYLLLGLAGLAMASCSQEDIEGPAGNGDGNVRFNVSLPGAMGTRAIELGTGYNANQLMIAVYENNDPDDTTTPTLGTPVIVSEGDFGFSTNMDEGDLTTIVNLNLVTGKSYYVAFFAASEASLTAGSDGTDPVYTFDTDNNQLKVNYGAMDSQVSLENGYECFYKLYSTGVIGSGNNSFDVLLTRPVAQINWGTHDDMVTENNLYQEIINTFGEDGQYIVTNASLTNVPNVMNFADLTVSGADKIELNGFAAPFEATFPVGGYNYVAMQYVLAGQTSANSNLTLTITNENNENATQVTNDVVVTEAPFQANYRTNIYGSLLSDNVEFNVEKNQNWSGMFNNQVMVSTPEDFINALKSGKGAVLTQDITVPNTLTLSNDADIELNNHTLTLSNEYTNYITEGASITIKNGNLNFSGNNGVHYDLGLKTDCSLTLDNVVMTTPAAGINPQADHAGLTVKNSKITSQYYAISSNANGVSEDNDGQYGAHGTVTLISSEFTSLYSLGTPILWNVPGTVEATDCIFNGGIQSVFIRGGNATFTDCTFNIANTYGSNPFRLGNWGDGNNACIAGLVVGNRLEGSYAYPASATLNGNNVFNISGSGAAVTPAIHCDSANGKSVSLNYTPNDIQVNYPEGVTLQSGYYQVEFATLNIIVNGVAVTTSTNGYVGN